MKKTILSLLTLAFLSFGANAQNFELLSSNSEEITLKHAVDPTLITPEDLQFITIEGTNYIDCSQSYSVVCSEVGAPMLPFFTESVIVPGQGKVELEITYTSYTEYEDILIAPSKGDLKRNILPSSIPFTFGEAYSTNAFYPGNLATLTEPFNLRNTRGVTLVVNPFQYNPVTKVLRVYTNLEAKVKINTEEEGINELALRAENSAVYADIYQNFYLNTNAALGRYTPKEEEGEMLIISGNSFEDELAPFIQWKTEKGIKTTLVTKSETGPTDTDIKNYITDFYSSHPDLIFVLLVGDHDQIPSHTYGVSGGEQLWSDSYYGQLTGDYYPELFIGRFSGNSAEITTMVNRTLEYEKNPLAGNWMTKAIGLASNEGSGYGDDGEADWQHARNNRAKLLGFGYSQVYEFYDGSHGMEDAAGDPNAAIINPAVNNGVGLFNYTGHGAIDVCVTGNYNSGNVNAATNNGKYPFVISVACNNGTFTSGTCISEVWMRATNAGTPSGAIAACGSTILMAWAEPMQTQDELSDIIAESYALNRKATLGGIFYNAQMSMLEDYAGSVTAKEVMQTWVMFGDPSTLFRNKETQAMTVNHAPMVGISILSIPITCDVEDATVSLVQNGEIIGVANVLGGTAIVSISPLVSTSPITVTATKQNYKPYQGEILVVEDAGIIANSNNTFNMYPNPASNFVTISWNTNQTIPSKIELQNMAGQVVYSNNSINGNTITIPTSILARGVYLVHITEESKVETSKLIIR